MVSNSSKVCKKFEQQWQDTVKGTEFASEYGPVELFIEACFEAKDEVSLIKSASQANKGTRGREMIN